MATSTYVSFLPKKHPLALDNNNIYGITNIIIFGYEYDLDRSRIANNDLRISVMCDFYFG